MTSEEVATTLGFYPRSEKDPKVLTAWIEELKLFKNEVAKSKKMSVPEKRRRLRLIERRIRSFEVSLQAAEKATGELNQPSNQRYQSSGDRYDESPTIQIPTGWRRSRSWQGGGLLPGGSWQGTEYQEMWGLTQQQPSSANRMSANQDRYGNQSTQSISPGDQQEPIGDWPQGIDQWPWPAQFGNGTMPRTGGGVMVGGGATSRSSRSSSSRSMRQSRGR